MRILHISKYYYPYIGGVENACKAIVEGDSENQYAVFCFAEARNNYIDEVNGVKVYRAGAFMTISRQAISISYMSMLRRAIKEFNPDIVHFHWANPFPAAVLLAVLPKRVKLVVHWHMDVVAQRKIYPFIKPFETLLLKRADLVLATSEQYLEHSKPLQPYRYKAKILPNCVDIHEFVYTEEVEQAVKQLKEKYDGKKIVFFVGRHIKYKGLPYLLEAAAKVKHDCVFLIGGNGPMTQELKETYKLSNVHFVGRISDEQLIVYHYAASIFAFPSITKNEAFGIALAEAMYCKKPAVTFTIPDSGVNWVCPNGECGLESPNGDSVALAASIDRLLADDELAKRLGENGHQRVMKYFTREVMIDMLKQYYKDLMA